MRGEFLDVGGVRLYYYAAGRRGEGAGSTPVVLLHGFPTSSHLWSDVAARLPEGHRVVVVDLLGYGRSDRPAGQPLTVRAHAERVIAALDILRVSRACVVGHEMGGAIALLLATRWPTRVSHLGLVSAAAFDAWPPRDLRLARASLPLTRHLPGNLLVGLLRRDLTRGYVEQERGTHSVDMYLRPFTAPDGAEVLAEHLAQLDGGEVEGLTPRLKDVVQPTAVSWGADDPFLPSETGERLASAIPGATLHVVPEARHFLPEEAPEQVAGTIAALLDR